MEKLSVHHRYKWRGKPIHTCLTWMFLKVSWKTCREPEQTLEEQTNTQSLQPFGYEATTPIAALLRSAMSGNSTQNNILCTYFTVGCVDVVGPVKTQRAPIKRNANGTIITLRANCGERGWKRQLNHLLAQRQLLPQRTHMPLGRPAEMCADNL